jgi:hypothetical protein
MNRDDTDPKYQAALGLYNVQMAVEQHANEKEGIAIGSMDNVITLLKQLMGQV